MKTKKGAYRFVIFSKNYVYKIPAFRYAWGVIKNIPRMLIHGDGKFIVRELRWGLNNFYRGLRENQSEYRCWSRMKAPFLVPTVFSVFGLMNIQKRQDGQSPSKETLTALFTQLPPQAQEDLRHVESHCIEPGNFITTPTGITLVDYDNGTASSAARLPFTVFLERWHRELAILFIPRIKRI